MSTSSSSTTGRIENLLVVFFLFGPTLFGPTLFGPTLFGPTLFGPTLFGPTLFGLAVKHGRTGSSLTDLLVAATVLDVTVESGQYFLVCPVKPHVWHTISSKAGHCTKPSLSN